MCTFFKYVLKAGRMVTLRGSKRVAVCILYEKLCFSGYLCIPFFTVQHTTGRIIEKFTNSN